MQFLFINRAYVVILFFVASVLNLGCNDDSHRIPYTYVDFSININHPGFSDLRVITNAIVVREDDPGVYGQNNTEFGVIIYRSSLDEFNAYDRLCPHEPSRGCAVELEDGSITAVCPCCETVFELETGYPSSGVSKYPLKAYETNFDGENIYVTNY